MSRYYRVLACTVGFVFILFCFTNAESKNDRILLTSFYPLYISALNVADGVPGVQVVNMAKPQTGCLHDYQLTPQDMQSLSKAWVLVVNGGGMESFVYKAIKQQPKLTIVEASKGIHFMGTASVAGINNHDAHENWDHGHATEIANSQHEELNPHIWVSVSGAIAQVKNIRDALIALDSRNAVVYKKNGDAYIAKLEELKEKMHEGLSNISSRNIITFHEAFPYFAREFNLNIVAVIEREPGSQPSAGELAKTISIIKQHKVKALFAEPQYPAKSAQTIANETGSTLYVLDPAVTGEATRDAYIECMKRNLLVLAKALR